MKCRSRIRLKSLVALVLVASCIFLFSVFDVTYLVKERRTPSGVHRNGRRVASISVEDPDSLTLSNHGVGAVVNLPINKSHVDTPKKQNKHNPQPGYNDNLRNTHTDRLLNIRQSRHSDADLKLVTSDNELKQVRNPVSNSSTVKSFSSSPLTFNILDIQTDQGKEDHLRSSSSLYKDLDPHLNTQDDTLVSVKSERPRLDHSINHHPSFDTEAVIQNDHDRNKADLDNNPLNALEEMYADIEGYPMNVYSDRNFARSRYAPKYEKNLPKEGSSFANMFPTRLTETSHQDLPVRNPSYLKVVKGRPGYPDINKLYNRATPRSRGYDSRVVIEDVVIPTNWTATPELRETLHKRKERVKEVCHKYGLDIRNQNSTPNAWEFLINHQYHLVWCNVFKAASSTWFYNFNLLAGYTEAQLLKAKKTPVTLARQKYERPTVSKLDDALQKTNGSYLSFMIARHPLERLVSGYRNKLEQGGLRFYSKLSKTIIDTYPNLPGPSKANNYGHAKLSDHSKKRTRGYVGYTHASPSFQQFVQYVLDANAKGETLNEHWAAMSNFCTPCLVDFDVYAKFETLQDDGNFVIFTSGIENVIKPKLINKAKDGRPTSSLTKEYMCKLSEEQRRGLVDLYAIDLEMFDYSYHDYFECGNS